MSTIESRTQIPAGTWNADPVHSQIGFEIAYMGGTFRGTFSPFEATLEVAGDGQAHLEGATQVASVKVQDPNLETHLQSPDFFDAERTPEIRFVADDVSRDGDQVTVRGDLTIRGVTKSVDVTFEYTGTATDPFGNQRLGLEGSVVINRKDYGVSWNAALETGGVLVSEKVTLEFEVSAIKAA